MNVTHVISLASAPVRLQFLAMERSLRAMGCKLPVRVIPYGSDLFDLPPNCEWWPNKKLARWVADYAMHPTMIKYQCLTASNYAYFDADICLLRDFTTTLEKYGGFVVADTDWNKPQWTYTDESRRIFLKRSSTWLKSVFNSGHFACDRALYSEDRLISTAMDRQHFGTCLKFPIHEQPGINLLVHLANPPYTNLTLPPVNMQSTIVADYEYADYKQLFRDPETAPYFIHWAGYSFSMNLPLNSIFWDYLTADERREWTEREAIRNEEARLRWLRTLAWHKSMLHRFKHVVERLVKAI